ncbi:MAG TPA: 1,4-alpha-glucan branching protein GlgB [Gaiellaceae bacterium]|nr:1,4-alpha-glucan branching protein GlgB [Gaiellaceae bacterium]
MTSAFGELDVWLARAGRHEQLWEKLGAHLVDGGVRFAVWAPNASHVSVVGDFNDWDAGADALAPVEETGIWEGVVDGAGLGQRYKYEIDGREKADPVAFRAEEPPRTASVVFEPAYDWGDEEWIDARRDSLPLDRPLAIYEVHAPSWRHGLGWRELADQLAPYVRDLGFTHVELMPVMHHPFSGSWGYQVTGYYAPLSTMGTPDDFRYFVDRLHRDGIGVILDWVPAHFPRDDWALVRFDGTALYEHADPRRGAHPDWGTLVFNLGRTEVQNFLLANALFWLREYHADGLRVDAVASMLYLDYSRPAGGWVPNRFGGREDLEAVAFLKDLNELVHAREPGVISVAEESTAWPAVSRPTYVGGLGFGFKWNLGWMNDTLGYFAHEPVHRRFHHHELTFSLVYAWNENFVLPLSHDEVVHGKGSLLQKMPGDRWQQLANLRALYGYMWAHPGKKLLFMGGELATPWEWSETAELPWGLLEHDEHAGVRDLVRDLNRVYRDEPALWEVDFSHEGFLWLEPNDAMSNALAWIRISREGTRKLVCVANLSPVPRDGYRVGLPSAGSWLEVLNTDSAYYGGGGVGNLGAVEAEERGWHGQPYSAELTLPPLGVVWLRPG